MVSQSSSVGYTIMGKTADLTDIYIYIYIHIHTYMFTFLMHKSFKKYLYSACLFFYISVHAEILMHLCSYNY